ncbi:MAG: alpha/beta fold hydrolase [Thermomonas sp.]|uniref:alpha/beta hydrolase family protein n=1 Tax=Thermomonas sp. TaxID=1971895 RepID=UPI0039E52095
MQALVLPVETGDGHRAELIARIPDAPHMRLLWMAGMGLPARHFIPFAEALAARGVAVFLHEWRGIGSSNLRASRASNWGYRELLADMMASEAVAEAHAPGLPRVIGGHSLGGQLSCCRLGLQADAADAVWLVGSGSPYWPTFPTPTRWWLPVVYRFFPWLARRCGYLPGRRLGFGGNEAVGVIQDWSRSALCGRYAARGIDTDLEAGMARFSGDVRRVNFRDDWLAPASSGQYLAGKLCSAQAETVELDAATLGAVADHYAWMKAPEAVAAFLANNDKP